MTAPLRPYDREAERFALLSWLKLAGATAEQAADFVPTWEARVRGAAENGDGAVSGTAPSDEGQGTQVALTGESLTLASGDGRRGGKPAQRPTVPQ